MSYNADMNQEQIRFQIDQLRKDKIIYAVEATATSVTAIIAIFLSMNWRYGVYLILAAPLAILYWLYVMVSNFFRLQKIKQLESQLK